MYCSQCRKNCSQSKFPQLDRERKYHTCSDCLGQGHWSRKRKNPVSEKHFEVKEKNPMVYIKEVQANGSTKHRRPTEEERMRQLLRSESQSTFAVSTEKVIQASFDPIIPLTAMCRRANPTAHEFQAMLPWTDFNKNRDQKNHLQQWCRKCHSEVKSKTIKLNIGSAPMEIVITNPFEPTTAWAEPSLLTSAPEVPEVPQAIRPLDVIAFFIKQSVDPLVAHVHTLAQELADQIRESKNKHTDELFAASTQWRLDLDTALELASSATTEVAELRSALEAQKEYQRRLILVGLQIPAQFLLLSPEEVSEQK